MSRPAKPLQARAFIAEQYELRLWGPEEKEATEIHIALQVPGFTRPVIVSFRTGEATDRFLDSMMAARLKVWPEQLLPKRGSN